MVNTLSIIIPCINLQSLRTQLLKFPNPHFEGLRSKESWFLSIIIYHHHHHHRPRCCTFNLSISLLSFKPRSSTDDNGIIVWNAEEKRVKRMLPNVGDCFSPTLGTASPLLPKCSPQKCLPCSPKLGRPYFSPFLDYWEWRPYITQFHWRADSVRCVSTLQIGLISPTETRATMCHFSVWKLDAGNFWNLKLITSNWALRL
jgi:hypothetical protein